MRWKGKIILRKWLKELRIEHQISQQFVADKLKISQNYYANIENGERQKDLDLSMAMKLAKVFDVSIDWIVAQEEKLK